MHDDTRVTRTGLLPASQDEPFLTGPTFAAPYHAAGDPSQSAHTYDRFYNPTLTHFEQALSELEGGSAFIFAAGMAAGTSVGESLDGERLLCLQSPSNPGLHVCDIAELTTQAPTAGALVAVNNTTPTILGQNRLLWAQTFPLPQTGRR